MAQKPQQPAAPDFALSIEENAEDSILHAFEHLPPGASDRDLKFAILHAIQGLELILKAYLASQHPLLIYTRPEEGTDSHTVDLNTALQRAMLCGIGLSSKTSNLIKQAKDIRNAIEHSSFAVNRQKTEGLLFGVLELFLDIRENHFDKFSDELTRSSRGWLDFIEKFRSYEARVEEAHRRAVAKLPDPRDGDAGEVVLCDDCFVEAVTLPSDSELAICENCGTQHKCYICSHCGALTLGVHDGSTMCGNCIDYLMNKD